MFAARAARSTICHLWAVSGSFLMAIRGVRCAVDDGGRQVAALVVG
jgi:hypothetical protein